MSEAKAKTVGVIAEFRDFIARGNVIDLAVGIIIGAAFNAIVKALVDGVLMPPIGLLTSGVDFTHLEWVLKSDNPLTKQSETLAIQYGALINSIVQFLIVAWAVFWLVKVLNVIHRKKEPEAPPELSTSEALLVEIRDLLKSRQG
jgi:large conductance mechanosensitive channel